MTSFPYAKLPRELQLEVIKHAVPPLVVPCVASSRVPENIRSNGEHSLLSLKLSCRDIYYAVNQLRPVLAIPIHSAKRYPALIQDWDPVDGDIIYPLSPPVFRFNLELDTLRVWDMQLPRVERSKVLPVRRLISMVMHQWCFYGPIFSVSRHCAGVVKKLKLDRLPHLQELCIVNQMIPKS